MKKEYINSGRITYPSTSLNKLYIIALTVVAVLSIVGQVLIQHFLSKQSSDSYLLNVSGRQRMLSQRICKLSLQISKEKDRKHAFELDTALKVWKKFHDGLSLHNASIIAGNNSEAVTALFKNVNPYFFNIYSNAHVIIKSSYPVYNQSKIDSSLKIILDNERMYLIGMERVVLQYEYEAREKVIHLKQIEMLLLALTLCVLFLEGFYIFRPASIKIKSTMEELIDAKEKLKNINKVLESRIRDRTEELSEKNLELEVKNNELIMINKDLDTFVYTTSHDLKGPIINIEGLVKALDSEIPESKANTKELISMMYESLEKFKTVLHQLADTGKAKLDAQNGGSLVSFKEVLDEIKVSIHDVIVSSDAEIKENFSSAPTIKFSPKNLRSILYNLITNSIKYRSPERAPVIFISTEILDNYLLLKVSDNGLGIHKEDISKVFSIYKRIHTHIEGTGVGLSIVKSIIENNGGKIQLESEPGKGSIFTIYFKV
jgi:signal transduction histidine kinase